MVWAKADGPPTSPSPSPWRSGSRTSTCTCPPDSPPTTCRASCGASERGRLCHGLQIAAHIGVNNQQSYSQIVHGLSDYFSAFGTGHPSPTRGRTATTCSPSPTDRTDAAATAPKPSRSRPRARRGPALVINEPTPSAEVSCRAKVAHGRPLGRLRLVRKPGPHVHTEIPTDPNRAGSRTTSRHPDPDCGRHKHPAGPARMR